MAFELYETNLHQLFFRNYDKRILPWRGFIIAKIIRSSRFLLTRTQRTTHLQSTSIRCRYYVDRSKTIYRRISMSFWCTYFFDEILIREKSTLFWFAFFDLFLMGKKSTSFGRTLFNLSSVGRKSTSIRCHFFDLISMDEKSKLFWCIFSMKFRWIQNWSSFDVLTLMFLKEKKP